MAKGQEWDLTTNLLPCKVDLVEWTWATRECKQTTSKIVLRALNLLGADIQALKVAWEEAEMGDKVRVQANWKTIYEMTIKDWIKINKNKSTAQPSQIVKDKK